MSRTYTQILQQRADEAGFESVEAYQRALYEAERERHEWEEHEFFSKVGEDDEIQEVS